MSETVQDLFLDFQAAVAARLLEDDWFTETPPLRVLTERLGDLASEIERDLTGRGLTLVVITPEIRGAEEWIEVDVVIGIGERPRVNRKGTGTGKTAMEARTRAIAILQDWAPEGDLWRPLRFVRGSAGEKQADLVDYTLLFTTAVRPQAEVEVVEE